MKKKQKTGKTVKKAPTKAAAPSGGWNCDTHTTNYFDKDICERKVSTLDSGPRIRPTTSKGEKAAERVYSNGRKGSTIGPSKASLIAGIKKTALNEDNHEKSYREWKSKKAQRLQDAEDALKPMEKEE